MSKRWRTWLGWGVFCAALIGLGFALDASLPPQPRLVLRRDTNSIQANALSADGTMLTTGTMAPDPDFSTVCISLKTWDTFDGTQRGEFFRGLVGANAVTMSGFTIKVPSDPAARGFNLYDLKYSPDRRYCALLHGNGLALADLQSGREWPLALKLKIEEFACSESAWIYRRLERPIDVTKLQETQTLRNAFSNLREELSAHVSVDLEAYWAEFPDRPNNPYRQTIRLPSGPAKMTANTALRLIMAQIGLDNGDLFINRESITVTTAGRARAREVSPPVFSPRGSFVALTEMGKSGGKLHVIECASGQLIATMPAHPAGFGIVGFTPDEELMYFVASKDAEPLFSVWDTRQKSVVRTFKDAAFLQVQELAPDGKTLATCDEAGGVDLLDLRTGARRRIIEKTDGYCQSMFSSDSRTLVRMSSGEIELWDVATGKQRGSIDAVSYGSGLFVSADSRVVGTFGPGMPRFRAWSLDDGDRLWSVTDKADPARALLGHWPRTCDNSALEPGDQWPRSFERFGTSTDQDDQTPRCTPDRRFVVACKTTHIDMLDPATGARQVTLDLGGRAAIPRLISFTPDSRLMASYWDNPARTQWAVEEWLGDWWPTPKATIPIVVSEVATGRVQLRVDACGASLSGLLLSDDGRTLATSWLEGDTEVISCWDVPGRPSLLWVVGIPLALAGAAVLLRWWRSRVRETHRSARGATHNEGR